MSGTLGHAPGEIIKQLMEDLGLGTEVSSAGAWPIYWSHLPDSPDSCLAIYDTVPTNDGRSHPDGITQEHYGFEILIRSNSPTVGRQKGLNILDSFDTDVLRTLVTLGDYTYNVQAITRRAGLLSLGRESPESRRRLHSINFVTDINLNASVGTGV